MRAIPALAAVLGVMGTGAAAADASPREHARVCIEAASRGQAQRDEGALLAAREAFHQCADATCPSVVRGHCMQWMDELAVRVPSIAVRAQAEGTDLPGATMRLDDAADPMVLDGKALELDPGAHRITVEAPGYAAVSRELLVAEGERSRAVVVTLVPTPMPVAVAMTPSAPRPRGEARTDPGAARVLAETPATSRGAPAIPTTAWVLAGVGGAAFVTAGATWYAANERYDALAGTCAPRCTEAETQDLATLSTATSIALGVGIAALTAAVAVTWLTPRASTAASPGAAASPRVRIDAAGLRF